MVELLLIAVLLVVVVAGFLLISRSVGKLSSALESGSVAEELRAAREENARQFRELREEVAGNQDKANDLLVRTIKSLGDEQRKTLDAFTETNREMGKATRETIDRFAERVESVLKEMQASGEQRFEKIQRALAEQLERLAEQQERKLAEVVESLNRLSESNRADQEKARGVLEEKFRQIQESNEKRLEQMRKTVDEKLQSTLEKRLGESFRQVSEHLEAVQRGLGEMKSLATGVGDLKRVLTNVKERGTWGEYQLGAILEQILTPDQYEQNVQPSGKGGFVEFAVKLPGKAEGDAPVWLPIDAKFPKEDYERLVDASARGDAEAVKAATAALAKAVQKSARDIQEKYIAPPHTTDFAILFLPTEGLYAEILRQPGLHDHLQSKYRVLVAGPTTLAAILNSLRVGFQTLAIEKRSSEVWRVLGAVKTEFGKFGEVLARVKKQVSTVSNTLDQAEVRTRAMERKLRPLDKLDAAEARELLELPGDNDQDAEE